MIVVKCVSSLFHLSCVLQTRDHDCRRSRNAPFSEPLLAFRLVDPLGQDLFLLGGDFGGNFITGHGGVLGKVDGVLPREELHAVLDVRFTSEVAVRSGLVVLGLTKGQVTGQGTGAAVEVDLDDVSDELGGQSVLLGAVGLDEDGQGLGDADGVRQLDECTLAQAGLDDGLGHPTAGVGGRTVDLGGVLTGEGATTVGTPTTVRVDDDLTSGETGVALGSTDDELAGGVDVEVALVAVVDAEGWLSVLELDALERGDDDVLVDELVHLGHGGCDLFLACVGTTVVLAVLFLRALGLGRLSVLRRDDDGVDLQGRDGSIGVLFVLDGDLRLTVGTEPPERTVLTDVRQALS